MGTGLDVAAFVTNAFDKEYTTYVQGLYASIGSEFHVPGMPRTYGLRLRYNF
jgi:outer membrane receptor protein involved in Fe transport